MDKIADLGRGVFEVVEPTRKAYYEILSQPANADAIRSTKLTTFSYGTHDRQKLDLYEPGPNAPSPPAGKGRPILVFFYGGGFVQGDKVLKDLPGNLIYSNLGTFFAQRFGYDVVIADYRLIEHGAKYPSGGEDVNGVLEWVVDHFKQQRDVFVMGNSAGGAHVASWLFAKDFEFRRKELIRGIAGVQLKGAIFLGAPLTIPKEMIPLFLPYYGTEEVALNADPTLLAKEAAKDASPKEKGNWPGILVLVSELDPEPLFTAADAFKKQWTDLGGQVEVSVLKGHNHISPPSSLATNVEKEELWGVETGKWMDAQTKL